MRKGTRGASKQVQKKLNRAIRQKDESLVAKLFAMLNPAPLRRLFAPRVERELKICLREGCNRTHRHRNSFCCAEHCHEWREANPNNGKQPAILTKRELSWARAHKMPGGRMLQPWQVKAVFSKYSAETRASFI